MRAPICYIAYPITAPVTEGRAVWRRHRAAVDALAQEVARAGWAPIVPTLFPDLAHSAAMYVDHSLVASADAVLVFESPWTAGSSGVNREKAWAREEGIPVVTSVAELNALRRATVDA